MKKRKQWPAATYVFVVGNAERDETEGTEEKREGVEEEIVAWDGRRSGALVWTSGCQSLIKGSENGEDQ